MKYFVTGATGFLGGEIVRQLADAGHEVRALVRDPQKAKWMEDLGVRLYRGDVTEKESMREAMAGVDGVFHVAGWYNYPASARAKKEGEQINVQGTRNVLELMHELKVARGVYTSTCAINSDTKSKVVDESYRFTGRHITHYDLTKAVAHEVAKEFIAQGLPLLVAMPGVIYGPGDTSGMGNAIREFLQGRLPVIPSQFGVCYDHVEDTARGHILIMQKGSIGEEYIIAGTPYRMVDAYRLASEITGRRMPMVVSHRLLKVMSVLVQPMAALLPETYSPDSLRALAGVTYWGDSSKARRELGLKQRPFPQGWEQTLRHEMKLLGIS
jgi:nucleoside-diphosphate-sugar epimerase